MTPAQAEVDSARAAVIAFDRQGERRELVQVWRAARARLTIEADFPGMDEAAAQRIQPRMERTARDIRDLIESDPPKDP